MGSGESRSFKARMTRLLFGLPFALLLGMASCASGVMSSSNFYRGQILDVETGKPLVGVLVVFVWYRDVYSPATGRIDDEFHSAAEVWSGSEGRFEVSAAPEVKVGPLVTHVQSPAIIFFAPGYIQERVDVKPGARRFRAPTRIYMKRVKNDADALVELVPSFPYERTPLLLRALNQERMRLGLPPIPAR